DIEPRNYDQVLLSLHYVEVPIFVHASNITRIEPGTAAVRVKTKRSRRFFGLLPVPLHHLRPANAQLARFADRPILLACLDVDYLALGIGEWDSAAFRLAQA